MFNEYLYKDAQLRLMSLYTAPDKTDERNG